MKILIIEDEAPALNRIKKQVIEIDPSIEIVDTADSIESAVELFSSHHDIDFALMDIELADGQSFEIFNRVKVNCPIIFTTAYDEFALKAFKVNSIDYLLKPIDKDELKKAFEKFKNFKQTNPFDERLKNLLQNLNEEKVKYKTRFLVKLGQKLISISVDEIAYFYSQDKLCFVLTKTNNRYVIDYTLEELAKILQPEKFFHVNRKYISSINSITNVHTYFNGKLKVDLLPKVEEEIIVSREKATEFKDWLGR
jgi:two-component system, LytTR family, response regulator LytT